jgi:hypothetical protein
VGQVGARRKASWRDPGRRAELLPTELTLMGSGVACSPLQWFLLFLFLTMVSVE